MKKIINNPNEVVSDMLRGMAKANPKIRYLGEGVEVIARAEKTPGKVGLITGGGSGHEPSFGGYVGKGMLDAAVAGNVFSSPSPDRIIEGVKAADGGAGVLMVIMNYSGDIMNFQMAREMVEFDGIKTDIAVVKDDVAVEDSTWTTGRRGIAGTLFVHKVAGAAAEMGRSLPEVKAAAEKTIANVRTMGMAMTPCILPAVGKPGFTLGEDECEIGMGIHGEPGINREKMSSAKELAAKLLQKIFDDCDYAGSEVAVMVNGAFAKDLRRLRLHRQRGRRDGQRPGRHAADGAVHTLRRGGEHPPGEGHPHLQGLRGQLHDQPGDGGRERHAAQAGRRAEGVPRLSQRGPGLPRVKENRYGLSTDQRRLRGLHRADGPA